MAIATEKSLIDQLAQHRAEQSLSILMPTHVKGKEIRQGPIELKNLLREATTQLSKRGIAEGEIERFLEPISEKVGDTMFWRHQRQGVAFFLHGNTLQIVQLREAVNPQVYLDDHFLVFPIVMDRLGWRTCDALALSWERARLFEVREQTIDEINGESFPADFESLVSSDRDPQEQLQFNMHRTVAGSASSGQTMFHGQGDGEQRQESDRHRYLKEVEKLLENEIELKDGNLTLIAANEVAGEFTTHTDISLRSLVQCSPEGISDHELHRRVLDSLRQRYAEQSSQLLERLGNAAAEGIATSDIEQILSAAESGKVQSLILSTDGLQMSVDPSSHQSPSLNAINLAVIQTINQGGEVLRVDKQSENAGSLPETGVAAIFRY